MGLFKSFKEGWHRADKQEEIEKQVFGKRMTVKEAREKWFEYMEDEHNEEFLNWIEDMEIKLKD